MNVKNSATKTFSLQEKKHIYTINFTEQTEKQKSRNDEIERNKRQNWRKKNWLASDRKRLWWVLNFTNASGVSTAACFDRGGERKKHNFKYRDACKRR